MIQSALLVLAQDEFVERQIGSLLCGPARGTWREHCLRTVCKTRRLRMLLIA